MSVVATIDALTRHAKGKKEKSIMWNKLILLALTIPMTITIASAQAAQDADIAAYSQDLARRIELGRQSGQLSQANFNSVQSLYNNVEMIRRGLGNRPMNAVVRQNMMTSLTNLDKQLTGFLHDDVNARYQMWDPTRRSWRNNWWQADQQHSGINSFNQEIDAYQKSLKERIDRGRASGRITRAELNQLSTAYDNIDRAQQQYRIGGFSSYERNSLMSMLTQLDRNITTQMHDDENSHYRNWNQNGNGWNNSWWKKPGTASFPGNSNAPGNRNDDRRDGWRRGDSGDHGNWNRGDSNRPDWNRGNSGRPDWNRNDGNRPSTSSTPSSGSGSQSNSNPPSSSSNAPSTGGSTSSSGSSSPNTGASNPSTGNNPSTSTPSAGGTPPAGSGTPSAGTGSTGGRGNWGGRGGEGSGDRTGGSRYGDGGSRNWGGSGSTRPQN